LKKKPSGEADHWTRDECHCQQLWQHFSKRLNLGAVLPFKLDDVPPSLLMLKWKTLSEIPNKLLAVLSAIIAEPNHPISRLRENLQAEKGVPTNAVKVRKQNRPFPEDAFEVDAIVGQRYRMTKEI